MTTAKSIDDVDIQHWPCADELARTIPETNTAPLTVRPIAPSAHLAFVQNRALTEQVSFLQCPAWGGVKAGWSTESVGWFAGSQLVGVATVLYRRAPWIERSLAYVPEGPVIDWFGQHLTRRRIGEWLDPLAHHARQRGAFALRMGPPLIERLWDNATVKSGLAAANIAKFDDWPPDRRDPEVRDLARRLTALGWRRVDGAGYGSGQPRYRLRLPLEGRDEQAIWAGLSQQWRRNIRISERAGVRVEQRGASGLPEFHRLYLQTAARDGFIPRQLEYFERMFQVFGAEDADRVRLYVAYLDDEPLAAGTLVTVGSYAWYGYGASADEGRDVRPSNALQWRMIRDCLDRGIRVYDLRGVADSLDADGQLSGVLRFKVGIGAEAVAYPGEWDLPLNRAFYRIFRLRTSR
jgi:lipid II:glycine glycyltransferase (peptidoglycan interpeptide bridge formation enzyme)